jgi:hypothetical protein
MCYVFDDAVVRVRQIGDKHSQLTHNHSLTTHNLLLLLLLLQPLAPPGVPASTAAATLNATYNDLESVKALFAANKGEIAGVILEPVVGNSGFIVPTKEFLQVGSSWNRINTLHKKCPSLQGCTESTFLSVTSVVHAVAGLTTADGVKWRHVPHVYTCIARVERCSNQMLTVLHVLLLLAAGSA